MQTKIVSDFTTLDFVHLPGFARYLLHHRLRELSASQLQISRQLNIPVLKYFEGMPDEQLIEMGMKTIGEFLTYLVNNEAAKQIEDGKNKWLENQVPEVDKYQISAEDITLITYTRKQSFLKFIPEYCQTPAQIIELIQEIDLLTVASETAFTNIYISLLKDRIDQHSHFIETINSTTPGAIFVFDVVQFKGIYSNGKLKEVLGYDHDELNKFSAATFSDLLHPDDMAEVKQSVEAIKKMADGEISSYRFRLKLKEGIYRWIRIYESVFNRDKNGAVNQVIGIALNVDKEKKVAEKLQQREQQLLEAQNIAQIGSFTWDMTQHQLQGSPKLYEVLELEEGTNDFEAFFKNIKPEERVKLQKAFEQSLKTGAFECEYLYNSSKGEKVLWSKAVVSYKDGAPFCLSGTVMDVTERQRILEKLKQSENMYKQAEAMANMGNYTMNLETGEIEWTDQLYRIYGLQPQSEKITLERFFSFILPDDKPAVDQEIENFYKTGYTDYTFRIHTVDGKLKTLRTIAQVHKNKEGKALNIVGTEQDITEHRRLIESLERNEALYKQAQSMARLGNWSFDVKTRHTIWSEELYQIYEVPVGTPITYEFFLSFVYPEDKEGLLEYFDECLRTKTPYNRRHRIVLRNGRIKTLHRRGELRLDSNGNVVEIFGTTQDITEQQSAENELKEKTAFIQKIADATPSIIASYNVNTGQYVFVNEGVKKLLGYDREEVLHRGTEMFATLIHPDDLPEIMEKNQKVLEKFNRPEHNNNNDIVAEFTYRMRHKNGEYRWFHTYGTIFDRNSQGNIEHILNISLDITEQTVATQKIKEQEHFIKQIADASPTILYLYNVAENSIEYINREVYYVLGYTTDEIIRAGSNITSMLYHPDDFNLLPERKESSKRFEHTDAMIQYECRAKNVSGDWCWLLVREVSFKTDENGKVIQILGAALDITRRKEMERTLLQNSLQLEQSNANLEEFAYVASHDLKEPLRKISTFGDRLLNTQLDRLSDDGKIYLRKIVDASQRMQTMINDLLSISMITGDRSFQPFSLQAVLDDVLQTLEYKIDQKAAIIQAEKLPEAKIVPSQFRQLFQNLLSNSLKFVQDDVQPVITIRYSFISPEELQHLQVTKAAQYLKLEFIDNGIGFEEEYAAKIFAIFQRLHGRAEYEGTGIGLAICKKIVEHHGGVIYASGEPGKGATFTIILPA